MLLQGKIRKLRQGAAVSKDKARKSKQTQSLCGFDPPDLAAFQ